MVAEMRLKTAISADPLLPDPTPGEWYLGVPCSHCDESHRQLSGPERGGPWAKAGDDKGDCEALAGLFAGALNRFRNPGAHTRRTFQDVLEAMEELMFASRLLRIVDERRPA